MSSGDQDGANRRSLAWQPLAASAAGVVVFVAAAVSVVTLLGGDDEPAAAAPPSTATATTTATTAAAATTRAPTSTRPSTSTSTTTTLPATTAPAAVAVQQFTQPIAPPTDARASEPVIPLGSIAIPKLGVDMAMYEGIRNSTLDLGPGHWPGSAMPGQPGNVVVGGHRTSKHRVFRNVDQLVAGDEIVFTDLDGTRHVYVVNRTEIVDPTAVWIVNPTDTPQATLFACHPPGSTKQRIIVFSDYRETIPPAAA